eukprot:CAMPEP_0174700034 /NCGR_PEP_ID=MMETSP1094-20130205/5114_1 /TAXON_ID=156173 /ORGANISM="Chrysochromulina brevifilum, Strain UTEX LB 985" /LENGTH=221 /DNA_ID=CAMNT_0015897449 /DNA_START=9 /DNA_END=674 /DNA_ORIENTATION=+
MLGSDVRTVLVVVLCVACCGCAVGIIRHRRLRGQRESEAAETGSPPPAIEVHHHYHHHADAGAVLDCERKEAHERRTMQQLLSLPCESWTAGGETECCVCLNAFELVDTVRVLPCGHKFHVVCVDNWFASTKYHQRTCPLCKADPHIRSAQLNTPQQPAAPTISNTRDASLHSGSQPDSAAAPVVPAMRSPSSGSLPVTSSVAAHASIELALPRDSRWHGE